jgi:hypothetical protein
MPTVHMVCDSTADLNPAFRAAHTVTVVPLKVIFGDETFNDGADMTAEQFYKRLAAPGPFPRTSQPTPAEFEAVFRELGADGGAIVCTTISADLSGTYASATQARAALPDLDIRVIDTRSVAVGHYAAVREAVRAIEAGGDADKVVAPIVSSSPSRRSSSCGAVDASAEPAQCSAPCSTSSRSSRSAKGSSSRSGVCGRIHARSTVSSTSAREPHKHGAAPSS